MTTKLRIIVKVLDIEGNTLLMQEYASSCEGDTCLAPEINTQKLVDDAIAYKHNVDNF